MEVNKEALEQLSIADLVALANMIRAERKLKQFPNPIHIEMGNALGEEIANRLNNIFIM